MSDLERTFQPTATPPDGHGNVRELFPFDEAEDEPPQPPEDPPVSPKIKWLRLTALLGGLGFLAVISTVFGMMMAVASELPALDVFQVAEKPTYIEDRSGKRLGELTGNQRRTLVPSQEIAPVMKQAVVAIEDKRFYEHSGVDFRGIARALWQDVVARRAVQGGSTITQQLVKNRLEAQNERTVLQKLREAAAAFHMTRQWDKPRILTNYLNTIYYGNGAYGIEAAAKTYFGSTHVGCGEPGQRMCAAQLEPHEAALLAGMIASPSLYDPVVNPQQARDRRNLVLLRMFEQGYLPELAYRSAIEQPLPTRVDVNPPKEDSEYPYFTTWVRQQVVDQVGTGPAFEGGLRIRTTIDRGLQEAAEAAVAEFLGTNTAPAAAMVTLDNDTGEVLAMVGGPLTEDAYNERPFNLATQGRRQPGSAFKPFVLAEALRQGVSPNSLWSSRKKEFCVVKRKGRCAEVFEVNNYDDAYSGSASLAQATAFSDNSVYAELGIKVGTKKVATLARRMGIRTPVSANPAMTLGGLAEGVTVLDMAHSYTTFANGGKLPYGTLSAGARSGGGAAPGPVGIRRITDAEGDVVETLEGDKAENDRRERRVLPAKVAGTAAGMLAGVVRYGTGKRASLGPDTPAFGKTGTTEDYGDAWFVGWTEQYTVAVWVGFPDEVRPMEPPLFSYQGEPVAGGTYPAAIWQAFMRRALAIYEQRHPPKDDGDEEAPPAPGAPLPGQSATPAPADPPSAEGGDEPPAQEPPAQTQEPAPETQSKPETAPEQTAPAPDDSGGAAGPGGGAPPPQG